MRTSRSVKAGLCAVLAAVAFSSACSAAQQVHHHRRPAPVAERQLTATVEYWGSFFGAARGVNYDLQTSPAVMTVPGPVAEIATSNSTQYALLTDGTLYAWGLGSQGQLGDGRRRNSFYQAVRVRFPPGVKIASIPIDVMPYDSALAVDTTGHVWGWGNNGGGEFCLGNTRLYATPVRLPMSQVTALAGASNHALYDAGGTVYTCGQNIEGSLGDGSWDSSTRPVKVAGLEGSSVIRLVASFANSGALLSNGKYFDWGYDGQGQLGDGLVHASSDVPVRVDLPHPVTQVALGGSIWGNGQTLVMLSDGSLWAWGDDTSSQLDDRGTGLRPFPIRFRPPRGVTYASLATGSATSYGVSTTGKVYAWGVSFTGQLGDGLTITAAVPVLVATGATAISATANNVLINVPDLGVTPRSARRRAP